MSLIVAALTLLDGTRFDAAMLDVNLHGEKRYPVADALAQRGIPFVFSTGYGHHNDRPDLADRPVLRRPYQRGAPGGRAERAVRAQDKARGGVLIF